MALIECPECGKKVSDRATSCPDCGYPIQEYIEEQNQIKELIEEAGKAQLREKRIKERMPQYNADIKFVIANNTFSFNKNDSICAQVGCILDEIRYKSIRALGKLIKSETDRPANHHPVDFPDYGKGLVDRFIMPFLTVGTGLIGMFLDEDSECQDYFQSDIKDAIDFYDYYDELCDVYADAFNEMERTEVAASNQHIRDRLNAGEPFRPFDAIYSPTLIGTLKSYISTEIVNSITEGITLSSVEGNKKNAEDTFKNSIEEAVLICDLKVYGALEKMIEKAFHDTREFVIKYLFEDKCIYQEKYYPKVKFDALWYMRLMMSSKTSDQDKIRTFCDQIRRTPAHDSVYSLALANISFSLEDIKNLINIIDFFNLTDHVIESLENIQCYACNYFYDDADIEALYAEYKKQVEELKAKEAAEEDKNNRTADNIVFSTIEEKESYCRDKEKVNELIISLKEGWNDDLLASVRKYKELEDIFQTLETELWRNKCNELLNKHHEVVRFADMYPTVYLFTKLKDECKESQKKKTRFWEITERFEPIEKYLEDDEKLCVIRSVPTCFGDKIDGRYNCLKIYVTNRYLYYFDEKDVIRFTICNLLDFKYVYKPVLFDNGDFSFYFKLSSGKEFTFKFNLLEKSLESFADKKYKEISGIFQELKDFSNQDDKEVTILTKRTRKKKSVENEVKKEKQEVIESELVKPEEKAEKKETMFCPYCGKQISRTAKFCNYCGKQNNYNK